MSATEEVVQAQDVEATTTPAPAAPSQRRDTEVTTKVSTKNLYDKLKRQFNPTPIQARTIDVSRISDYLRRLNIQGRIEIDSGNQFTIDVISDSRFVFHYIIYNITSLYPDYNIKSFPFASPFTLIAYCLSLYHAQMLVNDLYGRFQTTPFAQEFRNDAALADFFQLLLECRIPKFMRPILEKLTCVIDPQRQGLQYVPDYACFMFKHDFGRCIPSAVAIIAHDLMARTRTNADPTEVRNDFYRSELIQYAATAYTTSNLLGGPFAHAGANAYHMNWLNEAFDAVFNPIVGRTLALRPTYARTPYIRPAALAHAVNPYTYLLACTEDNLRVTTSVMKEMSRFFEDTSDCTLSDLQATTGYIQPCFHSVEPCCFPTWHKHNIPERLTAPALMTDAEYAAAINYMVPIEVGNTNLVQPAAAPAINQNYWLSRNADRTDAQDVAYKFRTYDRNVITPDILYYQPFDKRVATLSYTVVLGIKIEFEELDGVTVPLPDFQSSLIDNNSHFRCGSIPARNIMPYIPRTEVAHAYHVIQRAPRDPEAEPIGHSLRNMAINSAPVFYSAHNQPNVANGLHGLVRELGHDNTNYGFTYFAFNHTEDPPISTNILHLWSSFRFRNHNKTTYESRDISFYSTMLPFYGIGTTYSRSCNPIKLLPK